MVSKIRFRSFKDVKMRSRRFVMAAATLLALFCLVGVLNQPYVLVFAALLVAYVTLGLFEEVVLRRRRRAEGDRGPALDANEGRAHSDEDVLRELGAYEGQEAAHGPAV